MNKHIVAREIAAASKDLHPDGLGKGLAVFRDGTHMEATSQNDTIARGDGHGGWDYRVAYVSRPITIRTALEILNNIEAR